MHVSGSTRFFSDEDQKGETKKPEIELSNSIDVAYTTAPLPEPPMARESTSPSSPNIAAARVDSFTIMQQLIMKEIYDEQKKTANKTKPVLVRVEEGDEDED